MDSQFFQKAYEAEHEKAIHLAARLADEERKNEELTGKLNRIKGSIPWKLSAPLRGTIHFVVRNMQRVGLYGSFHGVMAKVKSKSIERKARKQHGTQSFPDAERRRREEESFPDGPLISILTPLYNTPPRFLEELLDSVQAQTYSNWELCLADGSDDEHWEPERICTERSKLDSRIKYQKLLKNEGISKNTNECYKMAKGQYIGLLDHDDLLHPSVLFEYVKSIINKNADYLYCDECTFHGSSVDKMITLHFKPDFSPDNLRANNYICHFSVFHRDLLAGEELFRSKFDGSQDHDMILRLTGHAKHIVHIPKLMYYWRSHKGSTAKDIESKSYAIEAARGAIADHLNRCGFRNFEILPTKAFETIFRIRYQITGNPKISILIPNRDHPGDIQRCVSAVLEKSSYDNYELLILENGTTDPDTLDYYKQLEKEPKVRICDFTNNLKNGFNYSAINNLGASAASGEYLVLLNNDTEVISLNWLEELLMYAQREDVGAVGAKLYYPDKTIQHAGIVIGLGAHRSAGHTHYKVASTNLGYMGRLCYAQNVSAVTGACLMVKKTLWDEAGGLDEGFRISLNDVDFCMKLRRRGLLNVWNPYCELYHYESASRGSDTDGEKARRYEEESARFRERYRPELESGDPYYNVNFSLDRSDYTLKL